MGQPCGYRRAGQVGEGKMPLQRDYKIERKERRHIQVGLRPANGRNGRWVRGGSSGCRVASARCREHIARRCRGTPYRCRRLCDVG